MNISLDPLLNLLSTTQWPCGRRTPWSQEQWFSKGGPGTTSICITWELVSSARPQAPLVEETLFGGGEAQHSVCQGALTGDSGC